VLAGWLLAATLLLLRDEHRARDMALVAVVLALAVYGGHPESIAILLLTLAVFVLTMLVVRAIRNHRVIRARKVLKPSRRRDWIFPGDPCPLSGVEAERAAHGDHVASTS
jgi:chromate transport protein ChrA